MLAMRKLAGVLQRYQTVFNASSKRSRYEIVSDIDEQLTSLLEFCPALQTLTGDAPKTVRNQYDYLPWARYTWTWKITSYRMKIHSAFLPGSDEKSNRSAAVSMTSGIRLHTRHNLTMQLCLECALTLLRHRKRHDVPEMWQRAW